MHTRNLPHNFWPVAAKFLKPPWKSSKLHVNCWLSNERCQESRLWQASAQCCQTTIASNSLWQNVRNNNKQSKNLNQQEMNCQKNKIKVYGRKNCRIPTLTTCELYENSYATQKMPRLWWRSERFTQLSHAAQIESVQLGAVAEIHVVQTDIPFFFSYLIFNFLYSLILQSDSFSFKINQSWCKDQL